MQADGLALIPSGTQGIEAWAEDYLAGQHGGTLYVINPNDGSIVTRVGESQPKAADAVYLTIDLDVLDPGIMPAVGTPEIEILFPPYDLRTGHDVYVAVGISNFTVVEPRGRPNAQSASAWTRSRPIRRTAICCTSSCRRWRTSAPTATAAQSKTGRASCLKPSRR